jgi:hypothetical protein
VNERQELNRSVPEVPKAVAETGLWRRWPQDAEILAHHLQLSRSQLLQLLCDERHMEIFWQNGGSA